MSDTPPPAPRTMRRPQRVQDDEPTEAPRQATVVSDGDDAPAPEPRRSRIRGGWTASQQVMDSTSSYAQAFRPGPQLQIVKFRDDSPYAAYARHWVERHTPQGVKKRPFTCLKSVGEECPLCDVGDRPQAVSAFNIAVVGDDGQLLQRSWDCGPRILKVLQGYNGDAKVGPLTKGFYAVSQPKDAYPSITPVTARGLREDYEIEPPTEDDLAKVDVYDGDIVEIPTRKELREIAAEFVDPDA